MKDWLSAPKNILGDSGMMSDHPAIAHGIGEIAGMASDDNLDKLSAQHAPEFDRVFVSIND
jgi:hypothetical protein